ncbi:flavodoxin family protein [Bacillus sonorensis]|uniref:flavodoxin family protein n=1 Tax=Bacillus sonorensis TaxID=119858 RepID=UPI0004982980|nr:flavodoxin family protein [Bacillus sonorensis]MCF7616156.1 flavodoxin family protein [Bacillus sonorensis]MCY7857917.1 flavodoxin family protein [Bacillus sonorensis]MCY8033345.1 flavodoxin family protein [Bacillus sonorensis]MCY8089114.1 flavodoxin family protein [Bacillus sonorensis]MCY8269975.1 flavodoxin family protein [Bacillus sonorensis]
MEIAAICGSSRQNGTTDMLVNQIIEGLDADKIFLRDYHVTPVLDCRHSDSLPSYPDDDYRDLLTRILNKDIVIFATPIYWYGMSGLMKHFIDRWSQTLLEKGRDDFKRQMSGKTAYVIAVGDDEPHLKGLPLIQQFQYIFDFMEMTFGGYLIGKGNRPGSIANDSAAVFSANGLKQKGRGNHDKRKREQSIRAMEKTFFRDRQGFHLI